MALSPLKLLLADDDVDDCYLFKVAVSAINKTAQISTIHDGTQLMNLLYQHDIVLPDMLFLDINMPRKNGFECLTEIKADKKFAGLQIIIYSTSLDPTMVNLFHEKGARYYIQKPAEFTKLVSVIGQAIALISQSDRTITPKEQFIITPQTATK